MMTYIASPVGSTAKRKGLKWRISLYRLWNLLLLCGIVNVEKVFSNDIDSVSNFTTSSFTGNASRDVDPKCAKSSLITYRATNFNESNSNSSPNCMVEDENRVNTSENNQIHVHKIIERYPRQNARRKGKKLMEEVSINSTATNRVQKRGKVSLLGLFELTSRSGVSRAEGRSELAAAELAVKHINERKLLKGYTLELITNDTQVSWL